MAPGTAELAPPDEWPTPTTGLYGLESFDWSEGWLNQPCPTCGSPMPLRTPGTPVDVPHVWAVPPPPTSLVSSALYTSNYASDILEPQVDFAQYLSEFLHPLMGDSQQVFTDIPQSNYPSFEWRLPGTQQVFPSSNASASQQLLMFESSIGSSADATTSLSPIPAQVQVSTSTAPQEISMPNLPLQIVSAGEQALSSLTDQSMRHVIDWKLSGLTWSEIERKYQERWPKVSKNALGMRLKRIKDNNDVLKEMLTKLPTPQAIPASRTKRRRKRK